MDKPEQSEFTSVYDRILASRHSGAPADHWHWLCPIGSESPSGREGILDRELADYLGLVDWTGHRIRGDKRGAIPDDLAPIMERLQVDPENWADKVECFGRMFFELPADWIPCVRQPGTRERIDCVD